MVRMRHAYAGGDFVRAKHQQQFMIAIAKKIKDLGAVSAVTSMFPKLIEFAETNITLDQALALAQILNDIEIDDIQYQTLEGKPANKNGSSVVLLDEDFMYNYMLEIMYGFNSGAQTAPPTKRRRLSLEQASCFHPFYRFHPRTQDRGCFIFSAPRLCPGES